MREREIVVHIDFSVVATNMKLKASIIMFMCIYMHMFCNSPHPKHALSVASLVRTSSCKEKAVLNQP